MKILFLIGIAVLGIAILSKIINTALRLIGIALLIGVLWFAYNSGFFAQVNFKILSPLLHIIVHR